MSVFELHGFVFSVVCLDFEKWKWKGRNGKEIGLTKIHSYNPSHAQRREKRPGGVWVLFGWDGVYLLQN